jgi:hypothetical protein
MSDDYKVGFGKPPREHRFQKRTSGNPKGRPRKTKDIDTLIDRELDQVVTMKEGGREVQLRKREAIVKRLVNSALTGSPRAIEYLVKYSKENGSPDPFVITAEDTKAFEAALKRQAPADTLKERDG